MLLFWEHGYEGVAISDLTAAMGIKAPSLYAAFGSKEELYRQSLQHYLGGMGDIGVRHLAEAGSAREGVAAVLAAAARAFTRPGFPRGCMVGSGSLRCAEENHIAREATMALRQRSQAALHLRLRDAVRSGELPPRTNVTALVDYFAAVLEGMSVQAQDGADSARLEAVGSLAMQAWPGD